MQRLKFYDESKAQSFVGTVAALSSITHDIKFMSGCKSGKSEGKYEEIFASQICLSLPESNAKVISATHLSLPPNSTN